MSKNLLIIYPHWHPVNLAGVHRPRLMGNYLKEFNWIPHVLTVEAEYFEERPDPDFHKTFSNDFKVTRVPARKVRKPRIIGDIGLRAMKNIRKKAVEIITKESIDFVWIPIPSFYMALVGRYIHKRTSIPYGIDYIDPWVRDLTNQRNLRAVLSQWIARILEPRAVKNVALITGVNRKYYEPVLERNKLLQRKPPVIHEDFPYGFDPQDHEIKLKDVQLPWEAYKESTIDSLGNSSITEGRSAASGQKIPGSSQEKPCIWLYTGAFLPNSHYFLDSFFRVISGIRNENPEALKNHQFWFIGTGPYRAKRITAYAKDHGIGDQVFEIRERFPYLQTLNIQSAADTIMIIGSTEKHYTASKTYQSLLSKRPVFSIFHNESQALEVLRECNADQFSIPWEESMSEEKLAKSIREKILSLAGHSLVKSVKSQTVNKDQERSKAAKGIEWSPNLQQLEKYSSRESARKLAEAMEQALETHKQ